MRKILTLLVLLFSCISVPVYAGEFEDTVKWLRASFAAKETAIRDAEVARVVRCRPLAVKGGVEAARELCEQAHTLLIDRLRVEQDMLKLMLSSLVIKERYQAPIRNDISPIREFGEMNARTQELGEKIGALFPAPKK